MRTRIAALSAALALLLIPRWRQLRGPPGIILVVACCHLVLAPLQGSDSHYDAAALPYAIVLAIVATVVTGTKRAFWGLVALTGATVLLWQPFRVPAPGASAYASTYYPGGDSPLIAFGGIILITTTLIWVLGGMSAIGSRLAASRSIKR